MEATAQPSDAELVRAAERVEAAWEDWGKAGHSPGVDIPASVLEALRGRQTVACTYCGTPMQARRLRNHLSHKCTERRRLRALHQAPYFRLGANTHVAPPTPAGQGAMLEPGGGWTTTRPPGSAGVARDPFDGMRQVRDLYDRVLQLHRDLGLVESGPVAEVEVDRDGCEAQGAAEVQSLDKHVAQHQGLHSAMRAVGLELRSSDVLVEVGAGRGRLALGLLQRSSALPAGVVLVERDKARPRNTADAAIADLLADHFPRPSEKRPRRVEAPSPSTSPALLQRLELDVRHLDLGGVSMPGYSPSAGPSSFVVVCKHLCGVGADLAIHMVQRQKHLVRGLCFATCCHHHCQWEDYAGKTWWTESIGMAPADFALAAKCSSWASLRPEPAKDRDLASTRDSKALPSAIALQYAERRFFGRACKSLIDLGRVNGLRMSGFPSACLQRYCESGVTVENTALLAWQQQQQEQEEESEEERGVSKAQAIISTTRSTRAEETETEQQRNRGLVVEEPEPESAARVGCC